MKRLLLILTVACIAITSCSKDKEGCNDRRASNYDEYAVVDNGTCDFTTLTFYADSTHRNGFQISSIDVSVDGNSLGSFSGYHYIGEQVCGSDRSVIYKTQGETSVSWTATINLFGGGTTSTYGIVNTSVNQPCAIVLTLPNL